MTPIMHNHNHNIGDPGHCHNSGLNHQAMQGLHQHTISDPGYCHGMAIGRIEFGPENTQAQAQANTEQFYGPSIVHHEDIIAAQKRANDNAALQANQQQASMTVEEALSRMSHDYQDEVKPVSGYGMLHGVLMRAYEQAARGKGKDRHANGKAFEDQPMQDLIKLYGVGFALGQAAKKAQESQRMPTDAAVRELLGSIVYIAGAIIALEAA